jgi:hypothetical protein
MDTDREPPLLLSNVSKVPILDKEDKVQMPAIVLQVKEVGREAPFSSALIPSDSACAFWLSVTPFSIDTKVVCHPFSKLFNPSRSKITRNHPNTVRKRQEDDPIRKSQTATTNDSGSGGKADN